MMHHFVRVGFKTSFHSRGSVMSCLSNFEQNYILDVYLSLFSYMCINGQG